MNNKLHTSIPKHVAIIMDGNRRWAKQQGLSGVLGHKKVVQERVEELVEVAAAHGIHHITFWAFSTENWKRSKAEVRAILELFRWALKNRGERLVEKGAQVRMIGDMSAFPRDVQEGFESLMARSYSNDRITVTFALNYGGRDEILRAIKGMMKEILRPSGSSHRSRSAQDDIDTIKSLVSMSDEEMQRVFEECLDTAGMPDPDLIIRTSGEQRLSGFLPWQSVYSELYFTDTLMPDLDSKAFEEALENYARRKRRFGG